MSYQVTPSISYGPNGEETVSYDNATVENSSYSEFLGSKGLELGEHEDYVYDPATDSYRHRYSDVDGYELERRLQAQEDAEEYDYDDSEDEEPISEELQEVYNLGYEAEYQDMIQWAAENLDPDAIAEYDQAMDIEDPEVLMSYIRNLWNLYEAYA